nr:hypothetical protein Itr_chr05CG01550 [Ipomoea trifida]
MSSTFISLYTLSNAQLGKNHISLSTLDVHWSKFLAPHTISNKTSPKLYTSALGVIGSARIHSGAMYPGVPRNLDIVIISSFFFNFASPKSDTFGQKSSPKNSVLSDKPPTRTGRNKNLSKEPLGTNAQKNKTPLISSAAKIVEIMAIFRAVAFDSDGGGGRVILTGHEVSIKPVIPVKFDASVSELSTLRNITVSVPGDQNP